VIGQAERLSPKNLRWLCQCECGNTNTVQGGTLLNGRTLSCGCLQRETATTHGMEHTLTYTVWAQMKARCLNSKHKSYERYGARGIEVCDRWLKFENFYADMGEKPRGRSLDRVDNNGNYEPLNCRWASNLEQNNNRSNNWRLTFQGKTLTVAQWAREVSIAPESIKSRLKLNWSVEDTLTTPVDSRKASKRKLLRSH
jgi:hypothetical protein